MVWVGSCFLMVIFFYCLIYFFVKKNKESKIRGNSNLILKERENLFICCW